LHVLWHKHFSNIEQELGKYSQNSIRAGTSCFQFHISHLTKEPTPATDSSVSCNNISPHFFTPTLCTFKDDKPIIFFLRDFFTLGKCFAGKNENAICFYQA
jgi:hypothetical protein